MRKNAWVSSREGALDDVVEASLSEFAVETVTGVFAPVVVPMIGSSSEYEV